MNDSGIRETSERAASARTRTSVTACLRCREQKLKCGRERPECSRCQRLDATCSYPLPPNRRGPRTPRGPRASNRAAGCGRQRGRSSQAALQQLDDEYFSQQTPFSEAQGPNIISRDPMTNHVGYNDVLEASRLETPHSGASCPRSTRVVNAAPGVLAAGTPVLSDSYSNQLRTMSPIATEPAGVSDERPLPPTALGLSLLELYFTRVYNAHLLFFKPTLFQRYLQGEVHVVLLKALFALATLAAYSEEDADGAHPELMVLRMYHSSGLAWARTSFKEAMVLAVDIPSLEVTQALECLQLYWFCIGAPYRANLCLALAYRSCHLLGYSKKMPANVNDSDVSFESELGRRCFWACWTSTCIVMEPEPYIKACWQEVVMVPLPGIFQNTSSAYRVINGERMDEDWHSGAFTPGPRTGNRSGPPALLMKMVGVWAKVQLLCKESTTGTCSISHYFDTGEKLSQLTTSLFDDAESVRSSGNERNGIKNDPKIDFATQRNSAATVAKHADLFRALLEPYLCGRRHVSFVPPLVGYGAFVAGIVLLVVESSCVNSEMNGFPPGANNLAAQTSDSDGFGTTIDISNKQLEPLMMNRTAESSRSEAQHHPLMADFNVNELEPPREIEANDPVTSQIDIPQDYDWFSLSCAEAGIEQFGGLEPSSLFQQGWQMFG
ncbi:unnamed protein product [Penicillium pancosmium]